MFELFTEPAGFRPKSPMATVAEFTRISGHTLRVSLIAEHSLWGHVVWNAAKSLANHIESLNLEGTRTLELGAAAALPSLVASWNGASAVATDYPEAHIINNILANADSNLSSEHKFTAKGLLWGQDTTEVLKGGRFDYIFLADLIFNHSEHKSMLKTCKECLKENGIVLTTFSHHLPKFEKRNMLFFDKAAEMGFEFEKMYEEKWDVMFEEDEGDVEVRRTVYCYKLWLQ
jgi:nicotinamide N-methyltransferase